MTIFAWNSILSLWEGSEYVSGFKYIRILIIRKFPLIWQDSAYAWVCSYGGVLNIPGLRICQVSAYASVAQGSAYASLWLNNALLQGCEFAWSTFHSVLNKPTVLNMLGLWIWQGCEYTRVTQGVEYTWISQNPALFVNMPQ